MTVKDLKFILQGLDESKKIEVHVCEHERVIGVGNEVWELEEYGSLGYVLELKGEEE